MLVYVLLNLLTHEAPRLIGAFFPAEHTGRDDAVEAHLGQRGKEQVPVDLAREQSLTTPASSLPVTLIIASWSVMRAQERLAR